MIHKTLGIPYNGVTGDRWIDASTGQHRVLSKGGAWENIDSQLTHSDERLHEVIQPEIVGVPEKSVYEHVRYSHPGAITSPAIELALSQSLQILDTTEVLHEEQAIEPERLEAIAKRIEGDVIEGSGLDTSSQTNGDDGSISGSEPAIEVQVSAALVDVGIDTDPSSVI